MFKIGDVVEITAEAAATGMLDFVEGRGYEVISINCRHLNPLWVKVKDESGVEDWFHHSHFKLKEDTIVEKKECLFKEGQVVWDTSYGRGVVTYSTEVQAQVKFDSQKEGNIWFTQEGVYQLGTAARNRTLFFSEPKIEAATEPLFEPTLKKGDVVIISRFKDWIIRENFKIGVVEEETEEFVYTTGDDPWDKYARDFYRLGEKINFK